MPNDPSLSPAPDFSRGLCVTSKLSNPDLFFPENAEQLAEAQVLCRKCPIREGCLRYALENKEVWGVWGGASEYQIRRTLSVDVNGQEDRRSRGPQCLMCGERTSRLVPWRREKPAGTGGRWSHYDGVTCSKCGFEWVSRTSKNAVERFHAEAAKRKQERRESRRGGV